MTQWAYRHRRSILFALSLIAIAGFFEIYNTPVSLFPQVTFPRVVVNLNAGDMPAERMAVQVTWPVEEAVRAVPGVLTVRSATSRGSADIAINFNWGSDMVSAMLQVASAINQIRSTLPAALSFGVRRMDPTVFPVLGYSLLSPGHSLVELRDIALYQIRPILSAIPGVAKVDVLGGAIAEYQVLVDPARINALGLSLNDIAAALSAANVIQAVGRLEQNYKLYLLLANTQLQNSQQISRTILRSGQNGLVYLEDVAQVVKTTAPQWQRITAEGRDAVLFQINQQPGSSTVEIARNAQAQLELIKQKLPADINIAKWYDQSDLIVASAQSVVESLLIGLGLAIVTLLVFLRNFKVTVIAAITVPMALSATVLIIHLLGIGFNIMTLGGMAAAVALIIDDAIVMIEHIIRRLREASGTYQERIHLAAEEFTKPLAGSSASTIIIFAPLAFLSGVSGSFFKALSITMASALFISFIVAWLAVPLLASHSLTQKDTEQEENGPVTRWFHQCYQSLLQVMLPRPWLILTALLPLLAAGFLGWQQTGSGFMPSMDEGGFILDYRSAPGTSVSETDRLLRQVETILRKLPEVETYSRRTGNSLGGSLKEANQGDFFVRLTPLPRRSQDEVMDSVRKQIGMQVPGLSIELAKLMEDLIGDLTAVPQPIEVKLYANDGQLLAQLANKIAPALEKIAGVVDLNNGVIPAGDAVNIRVLRDKAALEGLSPAAVQQTLNNYLSGTVTTQLQEGPKMVNLRVWIPEKERGAMRALEQLRILAPNNSQGSAVNSTAQGSSANSSLNSHWVPLKRIAEIITESGQAQIARDNLKRMVAVTARISGRDMGSAVADVVKTLEQPGLLPKDVYYVLGGLYEQQRLAFHDLIIVFAAAVALVFILLLYLYEQFHVALAMMLTTLSAVAAVFVGLWLAHIELNITAMMGMTMVIGIVTEVSIFYYSEYQSLPESEEGIERMITAGNNRMRPIAMTTLAAILALMPLAMGIGAGSEMLQPLAIAIVSGLIVQIPLVLVVLPGFLRLFNRAHSG
ncbi:putative RND efflux pump, Similar to multidrug efflux transporter AcrB [Candidatus Methylobacter favarea]|uniref:Putative RND efflux pump, Similar to multidrug efflux transporter AcrB n=1 Tax=Candidatus Methylobacter favarea TaxID=2707345 RepID=A0A8S0X6J0_9GAMM|nr:efflux RND transporter permease subunit [Candidatus Methylobacter favarea]CAA9889295.1 putative RND efflux pump, Similar to multidrug efflux transporter AcrB [Candidatus Methylobacter favarea]